MNETTAGGMTTATGFIIVTNVTESSNVTVTPVTVNNATTEPINVTSKTLQSFYHCLLTQHSQWAHNVVSTLIQRRNVESTLIQC